MSQEGIKAGFAIVAHKKTFKKQDVEHAYE